MFHTILGIFIILHGVINGFYFAHSLKAFELSPGMQWPTDSWILSHAFNDKITRLIAGILLLVTLSGFVLGGVGFLFNLGWNRYVIYGSLILSTSVYVLFWDGTRQKLHDQGGLGILINLMILALLHFVYG